MELPVIIFSIIFLTINVMVSCAMGSLLIWQAPRQPINQLFAAYMLTISIATGLRLIILFNFLTNIVSSALPWLIIWLFVLFVASSFLLFIGFIIYTDWLSLRWQTRLIWGNAIIVVLYITALLLAPDRFLVNVWQIRDYLPTGNVVMQLKPLLFLSQIFVLVWFVSSTYFVWKARRHRFALIACVLLLALIAAEIIPLTREYRVAFLLNALVILSLAYAILDDNLFNPLKLANRQLLEAKEAAEAANRAKSDFLSKMSHELRTPLNGILGYTQILQRDQFLNAKQRRGVNTIDTSGKHLLLLIEEILDFAKIEAQRVRLTPRPTSLMELVTDLAAIIRVQAENKGLALTLELVGGLPPLVLVDAQRLRQVLLNLAGNSLKFTPQGQIELRVLQFVDDQANEFCRLRFEVNDSGIGIATANRKRIFQPFEQAGSDGQQSEGAGLGLAISQQIVQMMGGEIQVESEEGVGSRFWFEVQLPIVALSSLAAEEVAYKPHSIVGYAGPRRTILVADDSAQGRHIATELLESLGFVMLEAETAAILEQMLAQQQPDVILQGLSEVDVTWLRQATNGRLLIALSANAFAENRAEKLAAGYDAFLTKPLILADLLMLLQAELGLEWLLAEETAVLPKDNILPPPELIQLLLELTELGDMNAIQQQTSLLHSSDYPQFLQEVRKLVADFADEELLILLQAYRDRINAA